MTKIPQSATDREARAGNLAPMLRTARLRRWGAAVASGLLLAACYEPLSLGWLSWLALLPVLAVGLQPGAPAWRLGYVTGLVYFAGSFLWLRTAMPPQSWGFPLGIGLICGIYPAGWLWLTKLLHQELALREATDLRPRFGTGLPGEPAPLRLAGWRALPWLLASAAIWAALEWVRGWFLSGLPWNQLAVSQWRQLWLLPVTRFTGVSGISFLIVAVNLGLFLWGRDFWDRRRAAQARALDPTLAARPLVTAGPAGLILALALLGLAAASRVAYQLPEPSGSYRILAVQGNLPQMRTPDPGQLELARDIYWQLTRDGVAEHQPDAIMWPETALPVYLLYSETITEPFKRLVAELETPIIVGALHAEDLKDGSGDWRELNSVLCIELPFHVDSRYDKIHPVPFGEYVPLGDRYPFLINIFGMGRNLSAGVEHTLYEPRPDLRMGFAICFEDCFADIARGSVLRGANALVTVTNDAWYEQTAGSAQHLSHAVFRSVETARPMMRNGNNSDTVLIMPDGRMVNRLRDPATGSTFTRQAALYELPIYVDPPVTFYTRYGDLFAWLCCLASLLVAGYCLRRHLSRRQRLFERVRPAEDEPVGSDA